MSIFILHCEIKKKKEEKKKEYCEIPSAGIDS